MHTRVCMCAHKLTQTQYFLMLHMYLVFVLMYWGHLGCTETLLHGKAYNVKEFSLAQIGAHTVPLEKVPMAFLLNSLPSQDPFQAGLPTHSNLLCLRQAESWATHRDHLVF